MGPTLITKSFFVKVKMNREQIITVLLRFGHTYDELKHITNFKALLKTELDKYPRLSGAKTFYNVSTYLDNFLYSNNGICFMNDEKREWLRLLLEQAHGRDKKWRSREALRQTNETIKDIEQNGLDNYLIS